MSRRARFFAPSPRRNIFQSLTNRTEPDRTNARTQFTRNLRRMSLRKKVVITNESETYDVVVRSPNADGGGGARRIRGALGYRDARDATTRR